MESSSKEKKRGAATNVPDFVPTPEQIMEECARIRSEWPTDERMRRRTMQAIPDTKGCARFDSEDDPSEFES